MEKTGLTPTDELIRLAIIGDGTAFTRLWDTHIDTLRSYIKGKMKNLDDFYVDDICSRSFEKAFRQIRTYDPSKSQFKTWLLTIARNTALDIVEQENRARRQYISLDDTSRRNSAIVSSIDDGEETALENIIHNEDQDRTQRYVDGLPDLYRQIARMRLIDGLQYKEIAEELEMELNTVRTRIRRAKALIEKAQKADRED
ncbi:MAG TPA: RNA polymerase sigma factor [Candidatus Cryptobacteroides sp.]|jgi:RNA polymerase sigma-70 factor (ECF subfamily)|nr:RNA polymerase sigma factor [Candidatus Cryptobacteroides sp.]